MSKATIMDNLVNMVSGLGTSRDKRSYSEFTYTDLGQTYLGTLYRNWMFGKVVDIPADDMTRKWRTPLAPSLTIEDLEKFTKVEKALKIRATVNEALKWARLFGGAGLIMNVNDGLGNLEDPLDLNRVKEGDLESVVAVDRYDLTAVRVNMRDVSGEFRLPEFYQLAGGGHIHILRSDMAYAIEVGLRMLTLRRLVVEENGTYRVVAAEERLLRYYANAIGGVE